MNRTENRIVGPWFANARPGQLVSSRLPSSLDILVLQAEDLVDIQKMMKTPSSVDENRGGEVRLRLCRRHGVTMEAKCAECVVYNLYPQSIAIQSKVADGLTFLFPPGNAYTPKNWGHLTAFARKACTKLPNDENNVQLIANLHHSYKLFMTTTFAVGNLALIKKGTKSAVKMKVLGCNAPGIRGTIIIDSLYRPGEVSIPESLFRTTWTSCPLSIINRDPSISEKCIYSVLVRPHSDDKQCIAVNSFIVTGMGADQDGDEETIYLPNAAMREQHVGDKNVSVLCMNKELKDMSWEYGLRRTAINEPRYLYSQLDKLTVFTYDAVLQVYCELWSLIAFTFPRLDVAERLRRMECLGCSLCHRDQDNFHVFLYELNLGPHDILTINELFSESNESGILNAVVASRAKGSTKLLEFNRTLAGGPIDHQSVEYRDRLADTYDKPVKTSKIMGNTGRDGFAWQYAMSNLRYCLGQVRFNDEVWVADMTRSDLFAGWYYNAEVCSFGLIYLGLIVLGEHSHGGERAVARRLRDTILSDRRLSASEEDRDAVFEFGAESLLRRRFDASWRTIVGQSSSYAVVFLRRALDGRSGSDELDRVARRFAHQLVCSKNPIDNGDTHAVGLLVSTFLHAHSAQSVLSVKALVFASGDGTSSAAQDTIFDLPVIDRTNVNVDWINMYNQLDVIWVRLELMCSLSALVGTEDASRRMSSLLSLLGARSIARLSDSVVEVYFQGSRNQGITKTLARRVWDIFTRLCDEDLVGSIVFVSCCKVLFTPVPDYDFKVALSNLVKFLFCYSTKRNTFYITDDKKDVQYLSYVFLVSLVLSRYHSMRSVMLDPIAVMSAENPHKKLFDLTTSKAPPLKRQKMAWDIMNEQQRVDSPLQVVAGEVDENIQLHKVYDVHSERGLRTLQQGSLCGGRGLANFTVGLSGCM